MCWFRRLLFHARFFGTMNKMQKSGCLLFPSFINLHFSLFLSKHFTSFCYCFSFFIFSFPCCLFSVFFSLPLFSSYRILRISSCYSTSSDQSLWFHSFKSSLFQRAIAVGRRANRNLNQCFSTAGPLLHVTPQQHQRRRAGGRAKEKEEEEGSQIHITHESHLTPTGRNHGPWRKGNSRPQALGELLGDREALYGRWDERMAGVLAQMELTDTYRHTDNIQLNINTLRHEGKRHITEKQNMTWLHGTKKKWEMGLF